jgi:hypothetical protein
MQGQRARLQEIYSAFATVTEGKAALMCAAIV